MVVVEGVEPREEAAVLGDWLELGLLATHPKAIPNAQFFHNHAQSRQAAKARVTPLKWSGDEPSALAFEELIQSDHPTQHSNCKDQPIGNLKPTAGNREHFLTAPPKKKQPTAKNKIGGVAGRS